MDEGKLPNLAKLARAGDLRAAALDHPVADAGLLVDLLDRPLARPPRHLRLPEARPEDLPPELRRVRREQRAVPLRDERTRSIVGGVVALARPAPRLPAAQAVPALTLTAAGWWPRVLAARRAAARASVGGPTAAARDAPVGDQPPAGRHLLGAARQGGQAGAGDAHAGDLPARAVPARRAALRPRRARPLGPHRQAVLLHLRAVLPAQGGRRLLDRGGRADRQQGDRSTTEIKGPPNKLFPDRTSRTTSRSR